MKRNRLLIPQGLLALALLVTTVAAGQGQPPQTCPPPAPEDMTGAAQFGDGTPGSCTQAALQTLISAGGKISCNCGPQPYTLTLNATLVVPNKEVIIDGKDLLTISGNNSVRIFRKEPAANQDNGTFFALQNLKLINGRVASAQHDGDLGGAAIASQGAFGSLKVLNVIFDNNQTVLPNSDIGDNGVARNADACGAVHIVQYKSAVFANCTFTNNKGANGGAVGGIGTPQVFTNCRFEGNQATGTGGTKDKGGSGGAVYMDGVYLGEGNNTASLCGCSFVNNTAGYQAGALNIIFRVGEGSSGTVDKCSFTGNSCAVDKAGAYYHMNGPLTLTNSTFANNTSPVQGGGLWTSNTRLTVNNCTFSGNQANNGSGGGLGGGVALDGSGSEKTASITNCTFAANRAADFASAIMNGGALTLTNNLFYNNLTGTGNQTTPYAGGTINKGSNLTVGNGNLQWPEKYNAEFGAQREDWLTASVLVADAQLLPLADNGGPTQTMALPEGSPAMDAGSDNSAPATDQRGYARIGAADIGSFEFSNPTTPPNCVASMTPANNATNVSLSTSITWTAAAMATSYDVYFGTSATPPLVGNQTTTTYNPGTLTANTDYYYQIVPKNGIGPATGCALVQFKSYTPPPCNSFVWAGNSDGWGTSTNWCTNAVPGAGDDVLIPAGVATMPTISGTVTCRNLTIESGASLTANPGSTLNVKGTWTNSGTFTATGGAVVFSGTAAQTVSGSTTFRDLTIDNAAGVSLTDAVTIRGALLLQNGSLSGQPTVDLTTGYISGEGNGSLAGDVTVKRDVTGSGWHYLSAPLGTGTAGDYADNVPLGGNRYYVYNEADPDPNRDMGWVEVTTAGTSLTQGIAIKTTGNTTFNVTRPYDHTLSPVINSAMLTNTGDFGDISTANGWHLVGNPFPSPLDWDSPALVKNGLANAIYFYNPTAGQNASYVGGVGTNGASGTIPAMQAFWVKVTDPNASLTFGKAARSGNTGQAYFRTAAVTNVLTLALTGQNGFRDEAAIRLSAEATEGLDAAYDAVKFNNPGPNLNLYTQAMGKALSINSLPLAQATTKRVPLYLDVPQTGQFTLTASGLNGFDAASAVVLEDSLTGIRVNLKEQPNYAFTLTKPGISSRFRVTFSYEPAASAKPTSPASARVWSWRNQIYIHLNDAAAPAMVSVFNHLGQPMKTAETLAAGTRKAVVEVPSVKPGIYFVQLIQAGTVTTKKVYITE